MEERRGWRRQVKKRKLIAILLSLILFSLHLRILPPLSHLGEG
jgi:hypothetical protein